MMNGTNGSLYLQSRLHSTALALAMTLRAMACAAKNALAEHRGVVPEELRDTLPGQNVVFGDVSSLKDAEVRADRVVTEAILTFLAKNRSDHPFAKAVFEGRETQDVHGEKGEIVLFVDPCDGSLNAQDAGIMNGFPHVLVLTVAPARTCCFRDLQAVLVLDLRASTDDVWIMVRSGDRVHGIFSPSIRSLRPFGVMKPSAHAKIELGKMNIVGELYYPGNREVMMRIVGEEKGWIRNPGSAAYEMASIASRQAHLYFCKTQKQHEAGIAYMAAEAMRAEDGLTGPLVTDFQGRSLDLCAYRFQEEAWKDPTTKTGFVTTAVQTEIVFATSRGILEDFLDRVRRSNPSSIGQGGMRVPLSDL